MGAKIKPLKPKIHIKKDTTENNKTKPRTRNGAKSPLESHKVTLTMSKSIHLISHNTVQGFGQSESRCLPCSGISLRAVAVAPSSSRVSYKSYSLVNTPSLNFSSKGYSFICNASSSNAYRRNPDFRQRQQGFSRNRNRQNEDKDGFEHEESDNASPDSGISNPYPHKYHATATPGPREREIVELFRKVQSQLRERAAAKEVKKIESLQGKGKESETVDSLLSLLRKHSTAQGKRKPRVNGGESREFWDQTEHDDSFKAEKDTHLLDQIVVPRNEPRETNGHSRPTSNFRRKSPVPQVTRQPIYSDKDTFKSIPFGNFGGNRKKNGQVETRPLPEQEHVSEPLQEEPEAQLEPEPFFLTEDVYEDISYDEPQETNGFSYSRPASNFRRKSPVPQVKYEPIYSENDTLNLTPSGNPGGNRKKNSPVEVRPLPESEPEHGPELLQEELETEVEPQPTFSNEDVYEDISYDEPQETNGFSYSRPISNFRRKSPVPQVKYQPIYPENDTLNPTPSGNPGGNRKKNNPVEVRPLPELEPEHGPELLQEELEPEVEPQPTFSNEDVCDEVSDEESSGEETIYSDDEPEQQNEDLSAMKVADLKTLAKSRGLKGFSKLKKSDLLELLAK